MCRGFSVRLKLSIRATDRLLGDIKAEGDSGAGRADGSVSRVSINFSQAGSTI